MIRIGFRNLVFAGLISVLSITAAFADWTRFAPELEEFSVETPVALEERSKPRNPSDVDQGRSYALSSSGTYFYVFSESTKLDTKGFWIQGYADSITKTPVEGRIGSFPTKTYRHAPGDGFEYELIYVAGRSRQYYFQTVSPTGASDNAKRFLDSITITPKDPVKLPRPDVQTDADTNAPVAQVPRSVPGSGRGTVNGNPPPVRQPRPPSARGNNEGIVILSKPRTAYSGLARGFEIQGKVLLRVVFEFDGKIGNVTIVQPLPFGLTNSAVAAAKGIVFEPAIKNGVPYSVSKMIEYSFTLF